MRLRILIFILMLGCSQLAQAGGGWVYMPGHGYIKLTQWWVVSPLNYNVEGQLTSEMPVGYFNTSLYAEFGLSDKMQGIVYIPFFSRMTNYRVNSDPLTPLESANGFGDVDISFKHSLYTVGNFVSSATITLGIPFGRVGLGMNESLATGDGELNFMGRIDISTALNIGPLNGWTSAYTAYNARSLTFNDEFRFGAELGFKFWKDRILLIGRLDRVDALGELEQFDGSIFSNNFEFLNLTAEVGYNFTKNVGLAVTYTKAVSGRSFYESPSFAAGVYVNF